MQSPILGGYFHSILQIAKRSQIYECVKITTLLFLLMRLHASGAFEPHDTLPCVLMVPVLLLTKNFLSLFTNEVSLTKRSSSWISHLLKCSYTIRICCHLEMRLMVFTMLVVNPIICICSISNLPIIHTISGPTSIQCLNAAGCFIRPIAPYICGVFNSSIILFMTLIIQAFSILISSKNGILSDAVSTSLHACQVVIVSHFFLIRMCYELALSTSVFYEARTFIWYPIQVYLVSIYPIKQLKYINLMHKCDRKGHQRSNLQQLYIQK